MSEYTVKGQNLSLTGDPESFVYTVRAGNAEWTMTERPFVRFSDGTTVPFPAPSAQNSFTSGTAVGISARYSDFGPHGISIFTTAEIETCSDEVSFTLRVSDDGRCEIDRISFPAPIDFGGDYGDLPREGKNNLPGSYSVLPRMQGTLIPAGTKISLDAGEIFERDAYMPIFGQVRDENGYLAIYDTPFDARYELRYSDGGEKLAPIWITSLGHMAYKRRIIYRFMDGCDYNDLAHAYRDYVRQKGRLVTLREKAVRNPLVEKLIGCPVIHEYIAYHISPDSEYYTPGAPEKNDTFTPFSTRARQIRELRARGLKKAYTHFDGWGFHGYDNLHPDPFPPHPEAGGFDGLRELGKAVTESGFIFGIHDQYRDFYYDAPSYTPEEAVTYADGDHPFCSIWFGGKHSFLCSEMAKKYVRRNYERFEKEGIPLQAAYLDVFSVVRMDECFHPDHTVSREQCAANRRECLDILTSHGIIPSSEEILDCILPSQVLCHHAPYFTSPLGRPDAKAAGVPIPLFNLVYHDCAVIPWAGRKGAKGGWGIPDTDSPYTHAFLNGGPVYISIKADEREICEAEAACENAGALAHCEMTRHSFLTPDLRTQRTEFSNGTSVTVNFDTDEISVSAV